jgi:hypothetical protein
MRMAALLCGLSGSAARSIPEKRCLNCFLLALSLHAKSIDFFGIRWYFIQGWRGVSIIA